MDEFSFNHLTAWVANTVYVDERRQVFDSIYSFVRDYPEVIERGDSWPEILRLATRESA